MKKVFPLILAIIMTISFAACSNTGDKQDSKEPQQTQMKMETILDPTEYALYQNIFYNEQGSDYEGKEVTKKGTFSTIQDKFNNKTRYYVWGYNDQTKCCDYQWELNITDESIIPNNGSLVEVTGTFNKNEASLDGYWIDVTSLETKSEFEPKEKTNLDMTTMDATLERVQIMNMQKYASDFEGMTVRAYGRIESSNSIQHPYYDGAFSQSIESTDEIPAIGTVVIVQGVYKNGIITDATIEITNDF